MYARSRSVFAPACAARCALSRPAWSCRGARFAAENGFDHCASAIPQTAMPHDGSLFATSPNASIAWPNSNECSSAIPRPNAGCTAALHELANVTVPKRPASCRCSCGRGATAVAPAAITIARVAHRMIVLLFDDEEAGLRLAGDLLEVRGRLVRTSLLDLVDPRLRGARHRHQIRVRRGVGVHRNECVLRELRGRLGSDVLPNLAIELGVRLPRPILGKLARHAPARAGHEQDLFRRRGIQVDV